MDPDPTSPFYDPETPVQARLVGGQACVFYGAAQFSQDVDLALLAAEESFLKAAGRLGQAGRNSDRLLQDVL